MSKYDKMLELNKRKSEEKVERAVLTIRTMVLERALSLVADID